MAEFRTVRTKSRLKPHKYEAHAALRKFVYERDNFTCQGCGKQYLPPEHYNGKHAVGKLDLDHIIPITKGGMSCAENLQTLCWSCNSKKGAKI